MEEPRFVFLDSRTVGNVATAADTVTMVDSVIQARMNLAAAGSEAEIEEAAADKGYRAADTLELCEFVGLRTYIPEPKRKHERRWTDNAGVAKLVDARDLKSCGG